MRTNGYWVYEITTPNEMVYVGMSSMKNTYQRWKPSHYKETALEPYINEFGWDVLKKEVVKDGLTKEEAFQLEDNLIRKCKDEGRCINRQGSGGLRCNGEWNQWYEEHKEEKKEYQKQYYDTHKEEIREQKREYMRKRRLHQKELRLRASLNYDTLW